MKVTLIKQILKKSSFFLFIGIFSLVVFSAAAKNNTTNISTNKDLNKSENCNISSSENPVNSSDNRCVASIPSSPAPTLNPNLSPKDRFLSAVQRRLSPVPGEGTFEYILLRQYGAPFINGSNQVNLPSKVIFANEQETKLFQNSFSKGQVSNGNACFLQKSAADALNAANQKVRIPLKSGSGGGDCTRTYQTTLRFWRKYANDQTLERVRQGKETRILGIVAPPGSSQHLWGLAIDLAVSKQSQRLALNENGWFQTVETDTPHWTYVGVPEANLPELGLRKKVIKGVTYWLTPL
jgi:D-alanyl-D-alanine carboxypeptidase